MQIYRTKYNRFIDENNIEVSQEVLKTYLENNGTILETDFNFSDDEIHENLENETELYIKRVNDGITAYARISAEFRLAKLSGQISEEQHHGIEVVLIPVRNEVLAGQWISARIQLEQIGSSIIGQQLYDRLHTQITNYINQNY